MLLRPLRRNWWTRHFPRIATTTSTTTRTRTRTMATSSSSSSCSPSLSLFEGKSDRFRGVTIDSEHESCDSDMFESKLVSSLANWRSKGVRAVWFWVSLNKSEWVPVLAKHGFSFHHTRADHVAMLRWMPEHEPNRIPNYAHHMIGVGAIVLDQINNKILVVKERFAIASHWKLPGGYVDPGEDLPVAAVREVKEETGIDTHFLSVVSLRLAHKANFGCSDFYIVTHLRPLSSAISICEREMSACMWMDVEHFLSSDEVHEFNKWHFRKLVDNRSRGVAITMDEQVFRLKDLVRTQQLYAIDNSNQEQST